MDGVSYEIIAEVSIALAGFAGVAGALQRRAQPTFSERDRLALRQMLGWSGMSLVFSLLPPGLDSIGLSARASLLGCSLALGILMLVFSAFVLYRNWKVERAGDRGPYPFLYRILSIVVFAEIGALLLSGSGVIAPNPGIYHLGLITCISLGFVVFAAWLIYRVG